MRSSIWFISALLFSVAPTRLGAALSVSTNFEGASARVLAIDNATQTVRITPAGDPARGWPSWWYLRVDGIDATKALTLEVVASRATLPASGQKAARTLDPAWAFPKQAAVSTNGIVWARTPDFERVGRACCSGILRRSPKLPRTPRRVASGSTTSVFGLSSSLQKCSMITSAS